MANLGKTKFGMKIPYRDGANNISTTKTYNGLNFSSEVPASVAAEVSAFFVGGESAGVTFGGFQDVIEAAGYYVHSGDVEVTRVNSVTL